MKKIFLSILVSLLCTVNVWAQPAPQPNVPLEIKDEGVDQGPVDTLNCVGSSVACTVSGGVGTMTVTGGGSGGGDVSSNTATSVIGEISLFADTTGKLIKRSTSSGLLTGTSGVIGTATVNGGLNYSAGTLSGVNAAADGATKGVSAYTANDFDAASGVISIDYTNGQKATGSVPGFLTQTDWTIFNGKQANLGLIAGTLTNAKGCTYTSSGTLLSCTTTFPSGAIVGDSDTQTLSGKTVSYAVASGAGTYKGNILTLTSTETQAIGDAVQINSSGQAHLAKADVIANASGVLLAASAVSGSASNTYLLPGGTLKLSASPSWTIGGLIYLSATGTTGNTLTQTAPSGANNVIQILGVAVAADTILFMPSLSQVEHI